MIFRLSIAISIWVSLILGKHIILCHGSLNISWALAKYKNPIKSGGRGFSSHKVPSSFLLYWASVRWQHIPLRSRELSPDFKSSNFRLSGPRRPRSSLHKVLCRPTGGWPKTIGRDHFEVSQHLASCLRHSAPNNWGAQTDLLEEVKIFKRASI